MQKFKRRQRHSLPFGLFLAVVGALLLPAAVAPRANAGPADYWFSEPQAVLINQPLAYNNNITLASNNVASGGQPSAFQPLVPDANASWTGGVSNVWSNAGNWTAGGPPTGAQIASFDSNFASANQPQITGATAVGTLHLFSTLTQNVTISATAANILTINGTGIPGTGVLIDSGTAFSLNITARVSLGATQTWTNNSGNLFTVSGATADYNADNIVLTVNGTGDTLISAAMTGGMGNALIKDGSGTLTITGASNRDGVTTVNSGTLLVNGAGTLGDNAAADVTVNSGATLGGNSTAIAVAHNATLTVAPGGNFAPGNGGNNTAIFTVGFLTLQANSNLRIDINGTVAGSGYDRVVVESGGGLLGAQITGSNLLVHVGTTLTVGQTFVIMEHGGGFTGQFATGTTVVGDDGTVFSVTYDNAGGQIVLTVTALVPEPSTYISGALAIAGLAFTQRRRLRKLIARRCAVGSS